MTAPSPEVDASPSVPQRLHYAIGPVVAGLILDTLDLATFGHLGIYGGFVIGATVGFWLTGMYRFGKTARLIWAVVAGIYCTVPFTEMLPLATILAATHRFCHANRC